METVRDALIFICPVCEVMHPTKLQDLPLKVCPVCDYEFKRIDDEPDHLSGKWVNLAAELA